jgi:hypothetical protein
MSEDVKTLIANQYSQTRNFSSRDLEQIDYKIHDWYQEYTDYHPDLSAREIVQRLVNGVHVRHQPLNLREELLEEFMSTNLAKLYIEMIEERRQLQKKGRLS